MCGVFGVAGRRSTTGLREAALTLRHRGPDGFGEWTRAAPDVYLAHCRLSILDLSAAGRQPMANDDGQIQITYNGEIYNFAELRQELRQLGHCFRSATDTEVLVRAYEQWGMGCLPRLRGIFAFGLWDGRRRELVLVRDRLGVKPLYYRQRGDELQFASEPRALLSIPGTTRQMNPAVTVEYLQLSYTSGRDTVWHGIQRLMPGESLVYRSDSGVASRQTYWTLPHIVRPSEYAQAAEQTEVLLKSAVTEQLVSDVPVGVFLSGGVDSSLVSTFASEASPAINSFCIDFIGWDRSELADAQSVAQHLGTVHHTCGIDRASCLLADSEQGDAFFQTWDEPFGDPAILPTWHLAQKTRQHVTVALSGDGGDELFNGYNWYQQVQGTPRRHLSWWLESTRRWLGIGRDWPNACADTFEYYQFLHCPSFSRGELLALFPDWSSEIRDYEPGRRFRDLYDRTLPDARRWQLVDLQTYLVDNNLARVDRASMAHSLEVRVPFLDHRLVEFAMQLPEEHNRLNGTTKRLLRELMQHRLPQDICVKPKQGFSFPIERFVSMAEMSTALRQGSLVRHGLLHRAGLDRWLNQPVRGSLPMKVWLLYVFEQWARHWLLSPMIPVCPKSPPLASAA